MNIADTLESIAHESRLNKAEKTALKLIAKDVRKLLRELKKHRQ